MHMCQMTASQRYGVKLGFAVVSSSLDWPKIRYEGAVRTRRCHTCYTKNFAICHPIEKQRCFSTVKGSTAALLLGQLSGFPKLFFEGTKHLHK